VHDIVQWPMGTAFKICCRANQQSVCAAKNNRQFTEAILQLARTTPHKEITWGKPEYFDIVFVQTTTSGSSEECEVNDLRRSVSHLKRLLLAQRTRAICFEARFAVNACRPTEP